MLCNYQIVIKLRLNLTFMHLKYFKVNSPMYRTLILRVYGLVLSPYQFPIRDVTNCSCHTIYVQDKQGIKISKIDFFATTPYILEVKKIRHILDT